MMMSAETLYSSTDGSPSAANAASSNISIQLSADKKNKGRRGRGGGEERGRGGGRGIRRGGGGMRRSDGAACGRGNWKRSFRGDSPANNIEGDENRTYDKSCGDTMINGGGRDFSSQKNLNADVDKQIDSKRDLGGRGKQKNRRRRNNITQGFVGRSAEAGPAMGRFGTTMDAPSSPMTAHALEFIDHSLSGAPMSLAAENNHTHSISEHSIREVGEISNKKSRQRQLKPKRLSANHQDNSETLESINNPIKLIQPPPSVQQEGKKNRNKRKTKHKSKFYPWRKSLPPGAVDPISLDPLKDLPYPPFALVVEEPYLPMYPGMWPPRDQPVHADGETLGRGRKIDNAEPIPKAEEESKQKVRELAVLKEQWGDNIFHSEQVLGNEFESNIGLKSITKEATNRQTPVEGRIFNLFDGRVLAYYLVSTLQFIDPLNRRDLTRPELKALDAYLSQHKLGNAGVLEAYDAKGVSVSTAGATAQSPGGRAEILQQEARAILSSFFSGGSQQHMVTRNLQRTQMRDANVEGAVLRAQEEEEVTNMFHQMYSAHERGVCGNGGTTHQSDVGESSQQYQQDTGIYSGGDEGLVVIDDDINPGLRGGIPSSFREDGSPFYAAQNIVENQSQEAQAREVGFPSLPSASLDSTNGTQQKVPLATGQSKSLRSIAKFIKKTDPAEISRRKKAREEAERKAALSQLSFFDPTYANSINIVQTNSLLTPPTLKEKLPPTEALLERNRNLAIALNVAPSTVRNEPLLTGWARPVVADVKFDQFGNELSSAQYPDSLLSEAQNRMTELVKLEKVWISFLSSDKEASCSLKKMDRPMRVFVHEYSDFWRLHTQSFDPEGRRYIHCSKLADTSAPQPLLSEAARKWRGPTPSTSNNRSHFISLSQSSSTNVQPSVPDGWRTEKRVPLKLAPRTVVTDNKRTQPLLENMIRSNSTPLLSMSEERPPPPRFAGLNEKERPKLQLAPRTIPSEVDMSQLEREREKNARITKQEQKDKKKHDRMEKKRALLERAFASDDEHGSSESDWFEDDAVFKGSDDEGL